jgi:hypothetical protein
MYADSQDELTRIRDDYLSGIPLWFIAAQLLASPRISHKIVASTVDNYSMPKSSLEAMDNLDIEAFRESFAK